MIRTAFSTSVREAGDLSAGVFDRHGRMLAQAVTGTPGHVNSMANAVRHFLDVYPLAGMKPGDHYITNDPWLTSGHLHDITVVTPSFYRGEAVGLFANTIHVVDIGGLGMGPDGRQVFEEGVAIPIMQLAREGRNERGSIAAHPRQCARTAAGRGRHLRLRRLQRRRQPPPDRDDGRIRDRQSRPARRHHRRGLARGDARPHPRAAARAPIATP